LLVEVDDDLRVRRRPELVTPSPEIRRQLDVVVDLPVEDDPDCPVLVAHRLMPERGEVQDREPPVRKPDGTIYVNPGIVRPAMEHRVPHANQEPLVYRTAIELQYAGDSTHKSSRPPAFPTDGTIHVSRSVSPDPPDG